MIPLVSCSDDQNIIFQNSSLEENHVNEFNFFTNSFTVDKKKSDTIDEVENIKNSDCELFCETDTDNHNYDNEQDLESATNDEETKNSDYELFCETDYNKKDIKLYHILMNSDNEDEIFGDNIEQQKDVESEISSSEDEIEENISNSKDKSELDHQLTQSKKRRKLQAVAI
ncbi:hypothetical protein FQA39_LY01366 [Lamprigera yunnana]|nr:hypothetical protein FQA39_LY01366 [Lamprigera yunnana]